MSNPINRQRLVKIGMTVLTFLGLVALVAVGGIVWTIKSTFDSATQEITDIKRYQEIRSQFDPAWALVKHFPYDIPTDATNVHLYFLPGFLQGTTIFQLKMKLPPKKITSLQSQYRPLAKRRYKWGSKNNSPTEYICPTNDGNWTIRYDYNCYTCGNKNQSFLPTYEILVLEDTRGGSECRWNHAEHYRVAIDSSASEIVYWVEAW